MKLYGRHVERIQKSKEHINKLSGKVKKVCRKVKKLGSKVEKLCRLIRLKYLPVNEDIILRD